MPASGSSCLHEGRYRAADGRAALSQKTPGQRDLDRLLVQVANAPKRGQTPTLGASERGANSPPQTQQFT